MSVRLNVVVVQSPRMTSLQADVVAEIVIQLLGRPGVDLALVTSLEPDSDEATDKLMLSSLESDIAVVDWRSPEESIASLGSMGVIVNRAPHSLDPNISVPSPGKRKLYAFDLRNGHRAAEVVEGILRLLASRQVMTVSLGIKQGENGATSGKAESRLAGKEMIAAATRSDDLNRSSSTVAIGTGQRMAVPLNRTVRATPDDDAALDALVDHLNDLDI